MKKLTRLFVIVALLAAYALLLAPTAQATEFRGGETVIIEAGETVGHDLYVTASRIVVDGTVDGDLIASGGEIIVNGVVTGDLLAAGQTVVINGTVEDDVRMAGASLTLNEGGQVADEIMSAGFSLDLQGGSEVGGDVTFFGGQAAINGDVAGNLNVSANRMQLGGSVGGDMNAAVDSGEQAAQFDPFVPVTQNLGVPLVAPGFTESAASTVGGEMMVIMPEPSEATEGIGGIDEVLASAIPEPEPQSLVLDTLSGFLNRFILLAIVALIVYLVAPGLVRGSARSLRRRPPAGFGWGLLWSFGIPLLFVLIAVAAIAFALFFGVIGLGSVGGALVTYTFMFLAASLLIFILVLALLAKVIAGYALGGSILRSTPNENPWLIMLIGLGLVALLIALPYVGFVFNFIISAMGLGSLWLFHRDRNEQPDVNQTSTALVPTTGIAQE